MSIKIYSGYRLDEGIDVFDFSKRVNAILHTQLVEHYQRAVLSKVISYYDTLTVANGEFSQDYRHDADDQKPVEHITIQDMARVVHKLYDVKLEASNVNVPLPQVSILYARDPKTQRILCYFFGSYDMEETFKNMEGVSYYGYWNNTDQEEGVSDEDWAERLASWERSVDLNRGLDETMLSNKVFSQFDLWQSTAFHQILASGNESLMPTYTERLLRLVHTALMSTLKDVTVDNYFSKVREALSDEQKALEYRLLFETQLEPLTLASLNEKYLAQNSF